MGDAPKQQHRHPGRRNDYEMSAKADTTIDNHNDIDCSSDDDEDDQDTEDSADENIEKIVDFKERPKPGRLDLRQFDNITSAIAKLNVQPQHSGLHKPVTSARAPKKINSWLPAKQNTKDPKQSGHVNIVETHVESPSNANQANTRRPLQIPRKNHGRPVAPPRLPGGPMIYSSAPSSSTTSATMANNIKFNKSIDRLDRSEPWLKKSPKSTHNEDGFHDLGHSPISQRLIGHAKDHKVSELNSPHDSDSEFSVTPVTPRRYPRAFESPNPSVTIGTYCRTHSAEPGDLISTRSGTIKQLNEILAKPPTIRPTATSKSEKECRKDKKRDEKLEKRKQKEEEKLRRQEEDKQRRQEKKLAAKKNKSATYDDKFVDDDGIPLFIKRCIEFIEFEGIDAEGIYRVPGNRAHVDTFVQNFKSNPQMSIRESDIPVNAVATALKDFLSKKLGPIIPPHMMNELTELSSISSKELQTNEVRNLVRRLPPTNYKILRYVFSHFVKISSNNTLNSMDSKNLAICWWPTLLPIQFNDMVMFEQMRPHLENSIQIMIDQFDFIFDLDDSALLMRK